MADNSTLPATGDVIRDIDKSGKKTQVVAIDLGGAGAESLLTTALPVSGTITANLSATDNAVLDAAVATLGTTNGAAVITDADGTLQQYLRGLIKLAIDTTASNVLLTAGTAIAGKVGIDQTTPGTTNKVSIGSDGTVTLLSGTAGIGKLTANSGVDIGDVDVTSIAAGTNVIGGTRDAGPSWTTVWGVSGAAVVSADMTSAAAVTDAPTGGQKICLDDIVISAAVAMNVLVEEQTSGTDLFKIYIPANGTVQITPRGKMKLATADKYVTCKASVAGAITVTCTYHSEA